MANLFHACAKCRVYIDLEKKFILHDCGDWRRTAREKHFCNHIGALMLALPEDAARGLLMGIKSQQWFRERKCFMISRELFY